MHHSTRRHWLTTGLVALPVLVVGCGFTLSRPASYPFRTIHISGTTLSTLAAELQRQLQAGGTVEVISDPRQIERAEVVLDLTQELREKVVIGRTATGAVREFQLRLRIRFRVRNREGIERIPETEIVQQRDISFSESAVLAKEAEEALLFRNMQTDLVHQILRRLAAIPQV
jgi:LPS-assembly lipoprotein